MMDGLLLLGFGGPTPGCCGRRATCVATPGCEAECFVSGILGDNPARARRISEVATHYAHFGGFSPYNRLTIAQASRLREVLSQRGMNVPVDVGFRHWTPSTRDGLARLAAAGCHEVQLLILAPHQSSVSWDWYLKHAAEAAEALGASAPRLVGVVDPWYAAPGFVTALVDRLREATRGWDAARLATARLVFTAHAVPEPVARSSAYVAQVHETARLAATAFAHPEHRVAFQSAPPPGGVAWTGPDILSEVQSAAADGVRDLVVLACGFLVDHTEVTYDLDVEATGLANASGVRLTRAACVGEHPAFISMLADGVLAAAQKE